MQKDKFFYPDEPYELPLWQSVDSTWSKTLQEKFV